MTFLQLESFVFTEGLQSHANMCDMFYKLPCKLLAYVFNHTYARPLLLSRLVKDSIVPTRREDQCYCNRLKSSFIANDVAQLSQEKEHQGHGDIVLTRSSSSSSFSS